MAAEYATLLATLDVNFLQMLVVFLLIGLMLLLFTLEKFPLELTSFGILCALLVFFTFFPIPNDIPAPNDISAQDISNNQDTLPPDKAGGNRLDAVTLLAGFANPALLTVLALLVLGEGLTRTGILGQIALGVDKLSKGNQVLAIGISLCIVAIVSAFLNNIPVVVLFIPIMQTLAARMGSVASHYMMPLSFVAILGGMTTLIGSSTNLLVSSAMVKLGQPGFSFFSFTIPGLVLVGVGMIYAVVIMPLLLPKRTPLKTEFVGSGKQFKAQMTVKADNLLAGLQSKSGFFPDLKGVTVLMVQRDDQAIYPPYEAITLRKGDVLVVAATRDDLVNLIKQDPTIFYSDTDKHEADTSWMLESQTVAEALIVPGSGFIGKSLKKINFRQHYQCIVLGIERRSSMLRQQVSDIVLKEGDILLLHGNRQQVGALRQIHDFILIEWSKMDLPQPHLIWRALLIFAGFILMAASGLVPTEIAALTAASLMIIWRIVPLDVAMKRMDRKIIFLIATALALGSAMEATGGATFLSYLMLSLLAGASPAIILSGFFLLVAILANILSTKATAVLFTPIAVAIANSIGAPPEAFAVAVVFGANCSFASPVGYQTNLLVMTPGRYRFMDFVRLGIPMIILCWISFSLFAPFWYDFP